MTRTGPLLRSSLLLVPLLAAGLLLATRPAGAQVALDGPATPAARALLAWAGQHIPAKFGPRGRLGVQPLGGAAMDDFLRAGDDSQDAHPDASGDGPDDAGDIDGVFVDGPPQITLRLPPDGTPNMATFAHEYGHYVWFDLLSRDDRRRYEALYKRQKAAHRLITDYAADSVEEGFAEAFSFFLDDPAALGRRDAPSFLFLRRWPAP